MSNKQCKFCEVERARAELYRGAVTELKKLQSNLQALKKVYENYMAVDSNTELHNWSKLDLVTTLLELWTAIKNLFDNEGGKNDK